MSTQFLFFKFMFLLIFTFSYLCQANAAEENVSVNDSIRSIAFDKQKPLQKRYEAVFGAMPMPTDASIYQQMRKEAMKAKEYDIIVDTYCQESELNLAQAKPDKVRALLDSAQAYLPKIKNKTVIGNYYSKKAYEAFSGGHINTKECTYYIYKAIDYYKQVSDCNKGSQILQWLYNLSMITNDTTVLAKNSEYAKDILTNMNKTSFMDSLYFRTVTFLYQYAQKDTAAVDSTLLFLSRSLPLSSKINSATRYGKKGLTASILYDMAGLTSFQSHPNFAFADSCIREGDKLNIENDSSLNVLSYYIKANLLYRQKKYAEAEKTLTLSKSYISGTFDEQPFKLKINISELYQKIYEAMGNYEDAMKWQVIKMEAIQEDNRQTLQEVEGLHKIEEQEKALAAAQIDLENQERIKYLTITISILALAALLFLIFWIHGYRKRVNERAAMLRLQKKEAEMQAQLKDEEATNIELEKYEILSNYHLKELELTNKDRELAVKSEALNNKNEELDELQRSHEELEKYMNAYKEKLNAYETAQEEKTLDSAQFMEVLRMELKKAFAENPKIQLEEHTLKELDTIDCNFLYELKAHYKNKLSTLHLKYCICFVLKMANEQIAQCFFIEPASVRTTRHRLKKGFGLGIDDDFELFLRHLAFKEDLQKN